MAPKPRSVLERSIVPGDVAAASEAYGVRHWELIRNYEWDEENEGRKL